MKKVLIGILFFGLAIFLYSYWGDPKGLYHYYQLQKISKNLRAPTKIIQQLQDHLKQDPNSGEGWYLLGRLYASQNKTTDATQAFKKAYELKPNDIKVIVNYAESLFVLQNPKDLPKIQTLLEKANQRDPKNPSILNLLAINAYQQKNYPKAIQIWEKLLEDVSPNSPDGKALMKAIAKAQQKM